MATRRLQAANTTWRKLGSTSAASSQRDAEETRQPVGRKQPVQQRTIVIGPAPGFVRPLHCNRPVEDREEASLPALKPITYQHLSVCVREV